MSDAQTVAVARNSRRPIRDALKSEKVRRYEVATVSTNLEAAIMRRQTQSVRVDASNVLTFGNTRLSAPVSIKAATANRMAARRAASKTVHVCFTAGSGNAWQLSTR